MGDVTAVEKTLKTIRLGYSDGSEKEITNFQLGEVKDTKSATATATATDVVGNVDDTPPAGGGEVVDPTITANPDANDVGDGNPTGGGSKKGGKKSRKPKSKRIRVRKTRRRKH